MSKGNYIIYPTETAYGLGTDARSNTGVEKIYEAKKRPRDKGLTCICSSLDQAKKYSNMSSKEEKIAESLMPGPITLVVEKKNQRLASNLNEQFAFRIPSEPSCRKLAKDFPITATSANISGEQTSYSPNHIDTKIKQKSAYTINEGKIPEKQVSTVAEVKTKDIKIHRDGPITKQQIEEAASI
jgi:L-threonylcarbamoyladenylate synthase